MPDKRGHIVETEISDPAVMTMTPVVSVVMITYNHEAFLAESIEGVLAQKTDFPIELIIGEDRSTDATRSIALEYQRKYPHIIRVVYADRNVGFIGNDTRIFVKARGEFIAYCEGDDYWSAPDKLQSQVDFLKARPDYGMVHSDYDRLMFISGKWRKIQAWNRTRGTRIPEGHVYSELLNRMFIATCTMLGRASLLQRHYDSRFRSRAYPFGDWPLVLHVSTMSKIGYLPRSLATYRRTAGSVMNSGWNKSVQLQKAALLMVKDFIDEFGTDGMDPNEIIGMRYRRMLLFSFRAENREEFAIALRWLNDHMPCYRRKPRVVIWILLMRSPWALKWYLGITSLIRDGTMMIRVILGRLLKN